MLNKIGTKTTRRKKADCITIAHVNCQRCSTIIEEREVIGLSKSFCWCYNCGLYDEMLTKKIINN